ncbi:hypothetical protein WEI85_47860 [Actinomycetes bacterium KLBMP 9797]
MDRRRARAAGVPAIATTGGRSPALCGAEPKVVTRSAADLDADETLTVDADAAAYRYRVVSAGGAGAYPLGFSTG